MKIAREAFSLVVSGSIFVVLALASGCTTARTVKRVEDQGGLHWPPVTGQGYLALTSDVDPESHGDVADFGCVIRLSGIPSIVGQAQSREEGFELTIRSGRHVDVFALPEGTYKPIEFVCGAGRRSTPYSRIREFKVTSGKISYIGHWSIGGTAAESNPEDATLSEWARDVLPKEARNWVQSGLTGKDIPFEFLKQARHGMHHSAQYSGRINRKHSEKLSNSLSFCINRESKINGFGLGRISFKLSAPVSHRLPPVLKMNSVGSFSDELINCLSKSITEVATDFRYIEGSVE